MPSIQTHKDVQF